jgi:hypothetical protein
MKLIAHRGNYQCKNPGKENRPDYISQAVKAGFDAEIDIWYQDGLYLGHDNPEYDIDLDFLFMLHDKLWIHCKNIQALSFLSEIKELNTFWHEKDSYALTSKGFIWTFPHCKVCEKSVVITENARFNKFQDCYGVCADILI